MTDDVDTFASIVGNQATPLTLEDIRNAVEFAQKPSSDCAICGSNHPGCDAWYSAPDGEGYCHSQCFVEKYKGANQ